MGYLGRECAEVPVGFAAGTAVTGTGAWPLELMAGPLQFLRPGNKVPATIDGVHNSSTTTINVLAGTGVLFKPGMVFKVTVAAGTTEVFKVISIATDALTVATRAFGGTAAALAGGEAILPYYPQGSENGSFAATLPPGGDGVLDLTEWTHGVVIVPGAWTAADLTFQTSGSRGGTYVDLCDDAGALVRVTTIATATSQAYKLPLDMFRCAWVKLRSTNTASGAAVNQSADRLLKVVLKR